MPTSEDFRNLDPKYFEDAEEVGPVVGPMPPSMMSQEETEEHIEAEFNRREERMKLKLSGVDVDGENKLQREEWMTELPSLRQVI